MFEKDTPCFIITSSKWQRPTNIGRVTGLDGLFATRLVPESGGLATNPPCDRPIEHCSTLHRGTQQVFVTEGPRQRFETEGGTATNPHFGPHPYYLLRMTAVFGLGLGSYHFGAYAHASWGLKLAGLNLWKPLLEGPTIFTGVSNHEGPQHEPTKIGLLEGLPQKGSPIYRNSHMVDT